MEHESLRNPKGCQRHTLAPDAGPRQAEGKQTRSEQRQADRDREGVNAIIDALRQGPATPRQLRAKTKLGKDRLQKLLDQLAENGDIDAKPMTIRGNQTHEYSLPDDSE